MRAQAALGVKFHQLKVIILQSMAIMSLKRRENSGSGKHPTDIIDMRNEIFGKIIPFSHQLQNALAEILESKSKKRFYLFPVAAINRLFCPDCSIWKNATNAKRILFSYGSEKKFDLPSMRLAERAAVIVRQCQSRHQSFRRRHAKALEEIEKLWGYKNTLVLDYDTAPAHKDRQKIIAQFKEEKNRILIGTQALLGKPEMPKADMLAVVSLDNLLYIPDYKIGERIYRLIHGIWAYANPNTRLLFQTYTPENEALRNILRQDYDDFYQKEISSREDFDYPPFSDIVKIIVKDINERSAKAKAQKIADYLEKTAQKIGANIEALGPSPAYIPKVKNQYIYQVVLKIINMDAQSRTQILKRVAEHATVDADPESIL